MSDDAPMRLKHAHATSPELAHALRALGGASDGERLQRVARQLETALAGAAPQPTAAGGIGSLALRWVIAGALAAGGLWAWRAERPMPPVNTRPAAIAPPAVGAQKSARVLAADGGNDVAPPNEPEMRASAARTKPRSLTHGARHAKRVSAANTAAGPTSDAKAAASTARGPDAANAANPPARTPSPPSEPAATAARDLALAPELHEQSHSQPAPAAASQAGGERSEAALLLAARKAQPSAALRLLAEHAARFPDGLLAPERDVLRIEALRNLGRAAEAEQELRAFQARYPDSIHLHRLLATQRD